MKGINTMNATIIVALLAAISAITAPILTSLINNYYQLKMKQIELYEEKRIKAINDYISSVSQCIQLASNESIKEMSQSFNSIFLYTSPDLWDDLLKINKLIENIEFEQVSELLPNIAQRLSPSVLNRNNYRK